jgi:hypothetical protein
MSRSWIGSPYTHIERRIWDLVCREKLNYALRDAVWKGLHWETAVIREAEYGCDVIGTKFETVLKLDTRSVRSVTQFPVSVLSSQSQADQNPFVSLPLD